MKQRTLRFLLGACFCAGFLFFPGPKIHAGEISRVFPTLLIFGKSWSYDYQTALSLSDLFEAESLRIQSYHCQVKTFYSLKNLGTPSHRRKKPGREKPNEDFSYSVAYHPMTVSVVLNHPRHGASVLYHEVDRVTLLHPFSFLPLTLSVSPHNGLVTSKFGHTIDHSDFRSFYHRMFRPACLTHSCLALGSGFFKGHPVDIVNIAPDQLEARPVFGRMWLLLDARTKLPLSVATYGPKGDFWERIDYENCQYSYR